MSLCEPPKDPQVAARSGLNDTAPDENPEPSSPPRKVLRLSCGLPDTLTEALLGIEPAFVPAEALALQLHHKRHVEHSDVLELWSRIPPCKRLRHPHNREQTYLVLGLSPRLPQHLTVVSYPLKNTVRILSRFVRQFFPDMQFTTISFASNSCKGPHRDLNNADGPAFITCLTQQDGGDLWIHDDSGLSPMNHSGTTLYGTIKPIIHNPTIFYSRAQIHCCTPWKNGPRTTLTAFTTLNARLVPEVFSTTTRKHLELPFPSVETLNTWAEEARNRANTAKPALQAQQLPITAYFQAPQRPSRLEDVSLLGPPTNPKNQKNLGGLLRLQACVDVSETTESVGDAVVAGGGNATSSRS